MSLDAAGEARVSLYTIPAQTGRFISDSGEIRSVIERVTGAFSYINTDHQYIHEGIAFKAHLYTASLAHSTTLSFSFKTPVAKYIHLKDLSLTSSAATVRLSLVRGTVASPLVIDSAGDTATELVGPHNVNDVSTITSGVVIKKTPTYTDEQYGAEWDYQIAPGNATNQFKSTMNISTTPNFEYVLKPDTYYVLNLTNLSGDTAASSVSLDMFWYEEVGA